MTFRFSNGRKRVQIRAGISVRSSPDLPNRATQVTLEAGLREVFEFFLPILTPTNLISKTLLLLVRLRGWFTGLYCREAGEGGICYVKDKVVNHRRRVALECSSDCMGDGERFRVKLQQLGGGQ